MANTKTGVWRYLTSSLAMTAGMAGMAVPALAQEDGERSIGEVVVTAQRFEQTIREVPVSIAAINGEQLENLGIDDLKEVTGQVPNLFINNFNGRSDTVRLFIRGIGQNDVSLTQDPSVALYIDNVYVGSAIGSSFDSLDLERVEILRGPQGTLYGRNATGGAVNLIPRRPQLEDFSVNTSVTGGTYNLRAGRIGVNVPVVDDLAVKIDYGRTLRDGWVENNGLGDDFSEQDRENARFALRWEPSDTVSVNYAYDWSHVQDTQPFTTATLLRDDLPFGVGPDGNPLYPLPGAPAFVQVEVRQNDPQFSERRPDEATSLRPVLDGESQISGHALNIDWDISPNLTFRSITGYRRIVSNFQGDYLPTFEGRLVLFGTTVISPYGSVGGQNIATHFDNLSQEFQLLGNTELGFGDVRFVTGAYYYTQEGEQVQASVFVTPRGGASATIDDKSWALFGEATLTPNAFDERLHLTFGARYSEDERSARRINEGSIAYARLGGMTAENCANQAFIGQFLPGECPATTGVVQAATYDKQFDNFSMSGSISYELTEDINIYGRIAQGYKTGGTSERSADPVLFSLGYEPEEILSYEIGAKGLYFDNTVSINAAIFYMELDRFQTSVQTGATPGERDFVGLDGNTYQGVEIDAQWAATDHLTVLASYGSLETEVGQPTVAFELAPGGVCTGTLSGATCTQSLISEFPYAPEQTITFGLNYDTSITDRLGLKWSLNYAHQSGSATSLNVFENTRLDQRGVIDGSVTLTLDQVAGGEATLKLWGRNIMDEDYRIVDNRSFNFVGAAQQAEWGEPATFGLTLGYRY
ncbi:MAG: TonB-dependent receptor [Hyphomonadaceae bacterium]|nr:TonB-dependent receptor [Hyphomonadaceae bacterium]